MKRLLLVLAILAIFGAASGLQAQDITPVNRMRIVLDLMKDGDVTTPASYSGVDLMDATTAVPWVDALIWAHRPQYRETLGDLTNPQKAAIMINIFRGFFRDARKAKDASEAADAARDAAIADVEADADTELGEDESEEP